MDPSTESSIALQNWCELKCAYVREQGVGADLPMTALLFDDSEFRAAFSFFTDSDGSHLRTLALIVASSLTDFVLVAADAFCIVADSIEKFEGVHVGDLQSRFADGDKAVTEVLMVSAHPRHGTPHCRAATYHYEGRVVVFDQVGITDHQDPGLIANTGAAVASGFRIQAGRPPHIPPLSPPVLAEMLGIELVGEANHLATQPERMN